MRVGRAGPVTGTRTDTVDPGSGPRSDTGSGSVLVLVLVAVLALGALVTTELGRAAAARHTAASAADLAALAAAETAWDATGPATPQPTGGGCAGEVRARAEAVARLNRARLAGCRSAGDQVVVEVVVAVGGGLLDGLGPARAAARAGPVADR